MPDRLPGESLHQRIDREFTNHAPIDPAIVERFELLRAHAKSFAHVIIDCVPDGQARDVALTNLRQSLMWAVGGIACAQEETLALLSDIRLDSVASEVSAALALPSDVPRDVTLGQVLGGEVPEPPAPVDPASAGPFADAADLEDVARQALGERQPWPRPDEPGADLADRLGGS